MIKNRIIRAFFNRCCQDYIYHQHLKKISKNSFRFSYYLTFDIDLKEDHKKIKDIVSALRKNNSYASFAVVGKWVEKYRRIYEEIVEEGHTLINHSYSHPYNEYFSKRKWNSLSSEEKKEEILKCHEVVSELGYEMKVFRTPHFGKQLDESIYRLLKELSYKGSSSFLSIDAKKASPYYVEGILELPIAVCKKHPFTALDSYHSVRAGRHTKAELLAIIRETKELYSRLNIPLIIYVDPVDMDKELLDIITKDSKRMDEIWG